MALQPTPLQPFRPDNIPTELRAQKRWAPWKAVWQPKRGKWDKIPCYPNGYGISTAKPERWVTFEAALAAQQAQPGVFAGVGYVMTGPHGIVGTDLDHCVDGSTVAPWALEIVEQLGSYTELSPSGTGLRIFTQGAVAADWTNHEIGIEVYGGNEPRFLTVTGDQFDLSAPGEITRPEPELLAGLAQRYARERRTATVISLQMPDLLDELALPDLAALELPYRVRDFLVDGDTGGDDRSGLLHASAVALFGAGLVEAEVFSVLASNAYAMGVALDHRRQDSDRALMYLWVEHTQKAKGKSGSKVATLDDFDDLTGNKDLSAKTVGQVPKQARFAFESAGDFAAKAANVAWLIKGVMPKAELGAIFGASGAGKSFFALDLAMAIALGTPWRGKQVKQGAVAYICAEGAGGFRLRIKAHAEYHGTDLVDLPLWVLGDSPNLLEKLDVKDLVAALRKIPDLQLILIDTLAQTTPGANENSGEDMGRALGHCKVLHQATGAMVVLVAHSGKDGAKGLRGWSGIKGALDVEIQVERAEQYRGATISKMKDGKGEGDEFSFELISVTLGQDEDGEDITSCVISDGAQRVSPGQDFAPGAGPASAAPSAAQSARPAFKAGPSPRARQGAGRPGGVWQDAVMRAAVALTDLPGAVTVYQLTEAAINQVPRGDGKTDRRRERIMPAITALVTMGRLSIADGLVNTS